MYKIGLSTGDKIINDELFRQYHDAGILSMEVSMPAERHGSIDWGMISSLSKDYAINLWSYHLPFQPFETLDISKPDVAQNTVDYLTELMLPACQVGIGKIIIHPSGEPIANDERAERIQYAKESLFALAEVAKNNGATIAVENLPRTCLGRDSAEIKELTSVHDNLKVCFDTNHLLAEKATDFISEIGENIITLHVSDYDFIDEKHWLPGEGEINWNEMLCSLENMRYDGVWMYELVFSNPKGIVRERELDCKDIAQNALSLFAEKSLRENF